MNASMFILHPVHQSRRMNLLDDFYIHCFQRRNTVISEQTQEDVKPHFDLIYDTQLNHAWRVIPIHLTHVRYLIRVQRGLPN